MHAHANLLALAPDLEPHLAGADHIDVKSVTAGVSLREFLAGMFSYEPTWMRALYAVRWLFVRLLGMKQEGMPHMEPLRPEDIRMTPGDKAAFFTVTLAAEDRLYLAEATEKHLTAYLGVVVEPLGRERRFHVVTIVHYRHWTGPVYFNVIRPFHHVVVRRMMQAGAEGTKWAATARA